MHSTRNAHYTRHETPLERTTDASAHVTPRDDNALGSSVRSSHELEPATKQDGPAQTQSLGSLARKYMQTRAHTHVRRVHRRPNVE
jgi:hypothetical protein